MNSTITKTALPVLVTDAALLAAACLIPTASHLLALPLYMLNPMLVILLIGIAVGRDWRNSLALAVLLPAISCLVAGMPTAPKAVCMAVELATVAGLFHLLQPRWKSFAAIVASIAAGKIVYYGLKWLIVAPVFATGTPWLMQAATALLWASLFAFAYQRR